MRIDVRIGDVRRRQKREAVAVAEVLPLQLPDAIPEDVCGSNRLGNEPQWSVAENVKWLAGVAHDDAVVGAAAVLGEPGKCPRAQVVVDPAVGEGLGRKLPLMHAQVVRRDLHRGKEPGKGRRRAHHLREACGLAGHVPERIGFPLLPLLEVQAVAVEDRHHAIADVRREDVQRWCLREFEEPAIAVEKPAVIRLQEGVWREARCPPAGDLADQPQRKQQRESADDPIADIELHEPHDLGRRLGKVSIAAGVTIPVEHEMGREHAAPRHRGDVRHQRQRAIVAEVADHAQVVERGPKPAARECEAEAGHAGGDLLTGHPVATRDSG